MANSDIKSVIREQTKDRIEFEEKSKQKNC